MSKIIRHRLTVTVEIMVRDDGTADLRKMRGLFTKKSFNGRANSTGSVMIRSLSSRGQIWLDGTGLYFTPGAFALLDDDTIVPEGVEST